jgi:hypothetical protein
MEIAFEEIIEPLKVPKNIDLYIVFVFAQYLVEIADQINSVTKNY